MSGKKAQVETKNHIASLEETLGEEEAADGNLNDLAIGGINEHANAAFDLAKGEE